MQEIYNPSHLKHLCKEYNLTPSKKYGQNYLISQKPIEAMIKAGELTKEDTVIEIGPGFGVLTLAIAPKVKKIISFEIEKKIAEYWEEKQKEYPNIEVIWGNALSRATGHISSIKGRYKVLANLPYQITSHAIRTILEQEKKPERVVLMVQKEVAERIVAKPGGMSLLAISVQYYGEVKIVHKVAKGSFWPAPKVDSAIISITNIQKRNNEELFFKIAKAGFANKRKQLWRNIADGLNIDKDKIKEILLKVCGNEKVRAQELSVEQWMEVVSLVSFYFFCYNKSN